MSLREEKESLEEELEKRMPAKGLLRYAYEYYESYKIISASKPRITQLFEVKHFLLCHGFELAMKSYLRHHGYTRAQLRKLGHNLFDLIMEMKNKYGFIIEKNDISIISSISHYYETKQFEYLQTGYKVHAHIDDVEKVILRVSGSITVIVG